MRSLRSSIAHRFHARDPRAARLFQMALELELKGKVAIANAKMAYQDYKKLFSGPRWESLAGRGAAAQRPAARMPFTTREIESPDPVTRVVAADAEVDHADGDIGEKMVLNMGPSHPATHGVLRLVLELDGEIITKATPGGLDAQRGKLEARGLRRTER